MAWVAFSEVHGRVGWHDFAIRYLCQGPNALYRPADAKVVKSVAHQVEMSLSALPSVV